MARDRRRRRALMPDLLLELFSEEIPARMQARAADDLKRLVTGKLVDAGLVYEGAKAFATPRRLALTVQGIPARQPDLKEEKKGPRVGAPDGAIQGFLRGAGLKSLDEATIQKDPKKGDFYIALIEKPGRAAIDVLAEMLPVIIRTFPWPKSMRWGEGSANQGALSWVRPLHRIVATFGPETEEPEVVAFQVDAFAAHGEALRRLRRQARQGQDRARSGATERDHPRRRQEPRLRAGLRAGRGSAAARRGRRPGRMAGGADGLVRRGVPENPGRGHSSDHPQQPEMLRVARPGDGQARQQVHPGRQCREFRPGQGHRRGQRARHPRAIVGCEVFLRNRFKDAT